MVWPRLAPFGDGFLNLIPKVLGRGGCIVFLLAKEERCLVDEDSDQPAFKGAFAAEPWRVARGGETAVFDCHFGFFRAVEDAVGDEMERLASVRELQLEGALFVFAGLAVGFEVAAGNGSVDVPDAFRGSGREFWGGGCHEQVPVLQIGLIRIGRWMRLQTISYHLPSAGQMKGPRITIVKIR